MLTSGFESCACVQGRCVCVCVWYRGGCSRYLLVLKVSGKKNLSKMFCLKIYPIVVFVVLIFKENISTLPLQIFSLRLSLIFHHFECAFIRGIDA